MVLTYSSTLLRRIALSYNLPCLCIETIFPSDVGMTTRLLLQHYCWLSDGANLSVVSRQASDYIISLGFWDFSTTPAPPPPLPPPQKLSESMNVEMAPEGIHVQCQVPLIIATKLAKVRKPTWDKPSPARYAKAGLAAIGHGAVVSPYWSHKLQLWVMGMIPGSEKIVFKMHKSLRSRALKKLAAKKD